MTVINDPTHIYTIVKWGGIIDKLNPRGVAQLKIQLRWNKTSHVGQKVLKTNAYRTKK